MKTFLFPLGLLLVTNFLFTQASTQIYNVEQNVSSQGETLEVKVSGASLKYSQYSEGSTISKNDYNSFKLTPVFSAYTKYSNITITGGTFTDDNNVNLTLKIGENAFIGAYNLSLNGNQNLPNAFTVEDNDSSSRLLPLTANEIERGSVLTTTLSGRNVDFSQYSQFSIEQINGYNSYSNTGEITIDKIDVISTNEIELTLSADRNAKKGVYGIHFAELSLYPALTVVSDEDEIDAGEDIVTCDQYIPIHAKSNSNQDIIWSSINGSGTFIPSNTQSPNDTIYYKASSTEIQNGQVTLTATQGDRSDETNIFIEQVLGVFTGNDVEQIGREPIPLSATLIGNNIGGTWSSSGEGIFLPNANALQATYTPSQNDVNQGAVLLSFETNNLICPTKSDNLVATLKDCGVTIETNIVDNKVTFRAINDNPKVIASYKWDFGNTATASGKTIEHLYDQTGTYTVTCTSQMSTGACQSESSTPVTINNIKETVKNLSGTLEINGAPLDYGTVQLFYISEYGNYELLNKIEITPSDNGQYQFDNLKASAYHVMVAPAANSTFIDQVLPTFVGGSTNVEQAKKVIVEDTDQKIDIALPTVLVTADKTWQEGEDAYVATVVFDPDFNKKSGTGRTVRNLFDDPEPVQEAIVLLSNLANELLTFTSTDEYGEFRFDNLNDGIYNIEISYIGSDARIDQQIVIDGDKQTRSDDFFVLKRSNNSDDLQTSDEGVNAINDAQAAAAMYIFPNPSASGIFTIAHGESTIKSAIVYNTIGQEILRFDTNKTIDLSNSPTGSYLVKVTLKNGQNRTFLIQKN